MDLPLEPPLEPMLARSVAEPPPGQLYEPKWDGFRAIVFRDGDEVRLDSRNGREITRFFPEVVEAVRAGLPRRCVADGEIIRVDGRGILDFPALQLRLHPARSRVERLRLETPATLVAFDLLALGDRVLLAEPFAARRAELAGYLPGRDSFEAAAGGLWLTPVTDDVGTARRWFGELEGAGLDGVIAKARDLAYQPGKRVMSKIKHRRTMDCVLAGYREHTSGPDAVGSLILGLYDADGGLRPVGVVGALTMARRRELAAELAGLVVPLGEHPWNWADPERAPEGGSAGRSRGAGGSRWAPGKSLAFVPLAPVRVLEVRYESLQHNRIRHMAQFERWRPDRTAASCTFDQVAQVGDVDLRAQDWSP